MKRLLCHTSVSKGEDSVLTQWKSYSVIAEDNEDFLIEDDQGDKHYFGKRPDYNGDSYKRWFHLVLK